MGCNLQISDGQFYNKITHVIYSHKKKVSFIDQQLHFNFSLVCSQSNRLPVSHSNISIGWKYLPKSVWLEIDENFAQYCGKAVQNCQNIYIKAEFESPKHLHQTTFEALEYLQQTMCGNCLLRIKLV
jgi:hypothetical protein